MTKYSLSAIFFMALFVSSCGYNQVVLRGGGLDFNIIKFDETVPQNFKDQVSYFFNTGSSDSSQVNNHLDVTSYSAKEYNIYAGNALRALEGEITLMLHVELRLNDSFMRKSFSSTKRYKSNELNPLAQNQMIKLLKESMQKEIIQQIIIEVSTLEM
ncbi:MAG: hypothetical protein QNK97_03805 [Gammaproteobacteria bacterium]